MRLIEAGDAYLENSDEPFTWHHFLSAFENANALEMYNLFRGKTTVRSFSVQTPLTPAEAFNLFIEALKAFDDNAWGLLIERYSYRVRHYIETSLKRKHLPLEFADDIEQETWLESCKQIREKKISKESQLIKWLQRLATHAIKTYQLRLSQVPITKLVLSFPSLDVQGYNAETLITVIRDVLSLETETRREIIARALLQNENTHVLASEYKLPLRTVVQVTNRAKAHIKARLKRES